MCGIFGISTTKECRLSTADIKSVTTSLLKLSQSRGKDASGLALQTQDKIEILKHSSSAAKLIKSSGYQQLFEAVAKEETSSLGIIGHARMVTNGSRVYEDNQPVVSSGLACIHNGIVVNAEVLWKKFSLKRKYIVDTEVILALVRHFLDKGMSLKQALRKTLRLIEGSASLAIFFKDFPYLFLYTNTGSLYFAVSQKKGILVFASEEYFLKQLLQKHRFLSELAIKQLKPETGILINLDNLCQKRLDSKDSQKVKFEHRSPLKIANTFKSEDVEEGGFIEGGVMSYSPKVPKDVARAYQKASLAIGKLKRCSRCILPETMPFITFDDKGVCNYCRNYQKVKLKGRKRLEQKIKQQRNKQQQADCIVAFSGGKDSSYALHYIKKVLGFKPIAYSYDWGMLTDLGRRNQARICGKLGVEHILISADIQKKRENIRKNLVAWLKKPNLGTVPLLMAGDKQFFYHANRLIKQTGIKALIFCGNPLEKTNFKSGFCGIRPKRLGEIYSLSAIGKLKIALYYLNQFSHNPAYMNSSISDTMFAYLSYYLLPHDFLRIYKFIQWDEGKIEKTLINNYDWETAKDTQTTWRIGDGTAAIYNYIYFMGAGLTENDTFRSNQIRESQIDREKALELSREENQPRFESMKWYCDIVGVDFQKTLKTINLIPRVY